MLSKRASLRRGCRFGRAADTAVRSLIIAVLAVLVTGAAAGVSAADRGIIRGRVVDRTPPVHSVAGQLVRLEIVERGASSERETRTDGTGAFVFTGLPVGGIRVFVVSTRYGGVRYGGEGRLVLTSETPLRSVPLAVYESGAGRDAVRGFLEFTVVDTAPGAVRVTTVEQLRNIGDRTFVPAADDPLTVAIPVNATAVTPLDGWRDPQVGAGRIADVRPVVPGAMQLTYSYQVPVHRGRVALAWPARYGAQRVEVLVADAHVQAAAHGLRARGSVSVSDRRYARWSSGPVRRGGTVTLVLDGLPAARDAWPGGVAGGLAALLLCGLVMALRR